MTKQKLFLLIFSALMIISILTVRASGKNSSDLLIAITENQTKHDKSLITEQQNDFYQTDSSTAEPPKQDNNNSFIDSLKSGFEKEVDGVRYSYKLIDSVPEAVKTVFPDVHFFSHEMVSLNSKAGIGAYYNGKIYPPVDRFNELCKLNHPSEELPLEDRLIAILLLREGFDKKIEITEIIAREIHIKNTFINSDKLNYEVRGQINMKDFIYYLFIENNQFRCICLYRNGITVNVSRIDSY